MKLVTFAIILYVLMWCTLASERPYQRPTTSLAVILGDESIAPASQDAAPRTEESMRGSEIEAMKMTHSVDVAKDQKSAHDLRAAQIRNFTTVVFILILMLLVCLGMIFLQMFKKDFKTINVAIVSVISFVVAMNFMVFCFVLKAVSIDENE